MTEEQRKNQIPELAKKLDELNIPYKKVALFGNIDQLKFEWCDADIVCHFFSYGNEDGLFEVMGAALMTKDEQRHDNVAGYITMTSAVKRIKNAYEKYKEAKDGND